jgi:hypothetical protein
MEVVVRAACLIYFYGKKYEDLGTVALNSFKKHNPEVDLYHVGDHNINDYKSTKYRDKLSTGLFKYMLAAEIMATKKYDKMIVLGADTITCSRLDEFLDNNVDDVVVTLDYPHQVNATYILPNRAYPEVIFSPYIACNTKDPGDIRFYFSQVVEDRHLPDCVIVDYLHFNADVVCFNSLEAMREVIKITDTYQKIDEGKVTLRPGMELKDAPFYAEQGGLNVFCSLCLNSGIKEFNFSIGFADGPYAAENVKCVYNVRSKGDRNLVEPNDDPDEVKREIRPWGPFIKKWVVKDNKMFDCNGKQIKVFHYCDGFEVLDDDTFCKLMNKYIFDWFNEDTKTFFKEQCDCGGFFEKEFTF